MAVATKRLLADTLIELLAKRPLDKITVKELVATCHVNRQTFYYHFQDESLGAYSFGLGESVSPMSDPSLWPSLRLIR